MTLTKKAQSLRHNQTDAESTLWRQLRSRQLNGEKFYRQFPITPYIADFVCRKRKLIIELDGGQHSPEKDSQRTQHLESMGYHVLRFWNNDVLENTDGVLKTIANALTTLTPTLSLKGEGESEQKV